MGLHRHKQSIIRKPWSSLRKGFHFFCKPAACARKRAAQRRVMRNYNAPVLYACRVRAKRKPRKIFLR